MQDPYKSRFLLSEDGDKLEIRDVNLKDAGEYRCFVGEKQHGVNLHVKGLKNVKRFFIYLKSCFT